MDKILVSVIIPTYKRNWDMLVRAVDSVRNQTYSNIEIIVVDDSPNTFSGRADIIENMKTLCLEDSRVIYVVNPKNVGGSLARNNGIQRARGQYITFLDDDDEYLENKVKEQVAFMQKNNCDLSFENMIMYNTKGEVVDVREYSKLHDFKKDTLLAYHLMHHLTGTPTFMFRTEALKAIGGFTDAKMGQEFHLMLKAIEHELVIRYNPICNVKIYKHLDGGISQGKNKIYGEKALYEFKKKYFSKLNKSQCRFIKFRHYAVMVVAYLRNKQLFDAMMAIIIAFVVSPYHFCKEVTQHFLKIIKIKKEKVKCLYIIKS